MIYLKKMNDPVAAARAFEAAGEVDRGSSCTGNPRCTRLPATCCAASVRNRKR